MPFHKEFLAHLIQKEALDFLDEVTDLIHVDSEILIDTALQYASLNLTLSQTWKLGMRDLSPDSSQ